MHTHRYLGLLGMLASPFMLLFAAADTPGDETTVWMALWGLIFQLGALVSLIGLFLTEATGSHLPGKLIIGVQMTLTSLAALFQILEYAKIGIGSLVWTITDLSWPFGFVFMFVTGGAVLAAGRWTGWRRWMPLLCALPLPATMLTGMLAAGDVERFAILVFSGGLSVAYFLMAYALFRYTTANEAMDSRLAQPSY